MRKPIVRILAILSLNLLVFFLARAGLFLVYLHDFHDLTTIEVARAFARGLLFDLSIILLVTGAPLLLMLLPWHFAHRRRWQSLCTWTNFVLLSLFLLLLSANLIYFDFLHRHAGPEITALGGDVELLRDMAFGSYAWALGLYVLAAFGLFILWRRAFQHTDAKIGRFLPRLAVFLFAVVGVAVLVRGGLGRKPLDVVDAFVESRPAAAYLSLNGPFAMAHSMLNTRNINAHFFEWEDAVRRTQTQLLAPNEQFLDGKEYPLLRASRRSASLDKPNVVVLMLESWDAAHIDVLRHVENLEPFGVTPNFDALAQQGLLFTHFYANGERSMDGLAALLAGIPTLPGTAYLGMGMEQNRMAYLGHMARKEGYETIFLQSSQRTSFHVDSIAAMAGFPTYLGAEDIPASNHSLRITARGAWDHDTFQEANRRFAAARKPFAGFVFTASTHLPFQSPGERWTKFTPDSLEHRFLNSLYYADWALDEFMASATKAGYHDNTIFILTADHVSGFAGKASDVPSMHHVPLLIIAPGLKPGLVHGTGGQVDVIPTLAQLAGWRAPQASLGHSLLDTRLNPARGTLCVRGNLIGRIEGSHWVTHDLRQRVGASPGIQAEDAKAMEERLLAMYQVGHALLMRNRITPLD
jgi:phosphoglycerol transferase MdoB-like AlkP superfamily enzyme